MLFGLFGRKTSPATEAAYAAIVAQARQPAFYLDFDIPDTMAGRFDMIVAHIVLFCARFEGAGPDDGAAMQAVLDRFFLDMDHSLREQGISDMGVPKRMKTLASNYLGRSAAYLPALAAGDVEALAAAVQRNIYGSAPHALGAAALARYMIAAREALARAEAGDVLAGRMDWPDPAGFRPTAREEMSP